MSIEAKYFEILNGPDMGISSKSMLCSFLDLDNSSAFGDQPPSDPSDFGRCHRLRQRVPEFKDDMKKLRRFKNWKPFIRNWDVLTKLYLIELENKDGKAPILYAFMRELSAKS